MKKKVIEVLKEAVRDFMKLMTWGLVFLHLWEAFELPELRWLGFLIGIFTIILEKLTN